MVEDFLGLLAYCNGAHEQVREEIGQLIMVYREMHFELVLVDERSEKGNGVLQLSEVG
jgi:hypothetical protein